MTAWTRSELLRRLAEAGLRPKKALGQNFLLDPNFLRSIVRDAGIRSGDSVVEIGTGPGNLTSVLEESGAEVWSFEIDRELHTFAVGLLSDRERVHLVCGDGAGFAAALPAGPRWKVVGNLPYFDYQRIVLSVLEAPLEVESCTFLIQKDVADRMKAGPGDDSYGPLSVLLQGCGGVTVLRRAGAKLFHPVPRVESALVTFRRPEPLPATRLLEVLQGMFFQPRKKIDRWLEGQGWTEREADLCGKRAGEIPSATLFRLARTAMIRPR